MRRSLATTAAAGVLALGAVALLSGCGGGSSAATPAVSGGSSTATTSAAQNGIPALDLTKGSALFALFKSQGMCDSDDADPTDGFPDSNGAPALHIKIEGSLSCYGPTDPVADGKYAAVVYSYADTASVARAVKATANCHCADYWKPVGNQRWLVFLDESFWKLTQAQKTLSGIAVNVPRSG